MKIQIKIVSYALVAGLGLVQPVRAQGQSSTPLAGGALSLKQAIATALEKQPLLATATHTVRAAEARTDQARAPFYPQVGASAIETSGALRVNALLRPSGSLIQPNQDNFIGGLSATQLLYDFGQTAHRVETNRLTAQALGDDLLTQKANVILNVQRAYYEGLKRKRLVQIAEDTVRERGVIQQQIASLYRQQLKSKLDADLVQVELSKAEVDLIRAKNDLQASYATLNNAMGVEGSQEYTLEDLPVTVTGTRPLDHLLATGQEKRPELVAARARIQAAEQRIKAAQSQNFPTIQAVGSAGDAEQFSGPPNSREGGWWGAGVAVTVPLFTGFLIQNQVREAVEQQQEAQSSARTLEQAVRLDVTNAFLTVGTLAQQIHAIEVLVTQTREALQLAQERYRLGLSSIVEVTQGEVAVTGAETSLAEAQYDYKTAEAILTYAVGEGYQAF
jgi:outer membrane protein